MRLSRSCRVEATQLKIVVKVRFDWRWVVEARPLQCLVVFTHAVERFALDAHVHTVVVACRAPSLRLVTPDVHERDLGAAERTLAIEGPAHGTDA